ncbi:MAG: hydroxyacid dehydrogenase [Clostridia bacterium]|nr:hydroxyacid dehydrogenase [Clostridia bacterium]
MKITVLDAETLGADLDLAPLRALGELHVYGSTAPADAAARLADTDVAVINKIRIDRDTLAGNTRLRMIAETATGFDNIDLAVCREKGIAVSNVKGYSTDSVVQVTLAMALSLSTKLPAYSRTVADGSYTAEGVANRLTPVYHELCGKTWGIVGYGHIGAKVASVARALGCRVIAFAKSPKTGVENVDLPTLCRIADIISVHLPLSPETRGIIGEKEIAMMKRDAIFINVARGAVTDEAALAAAVAEGRLGGIGVDVFSVEPFPPTHPFYAIRHMENVCLTPHMAWGAKEARERCLSEVAANIAAFLAGERRNRVE